MKKIYTLFAALLLFKVNLFAQSGLGEIRGKILDAKTKKPLDYVSVTLKLNGVTKASTLTDDDGNFIIKTLQPGSYDLFATYIGYLNQTITGVNVTADEIRFVNFSMTKSEEGQTLKEVVVEYKKPLVDPGGVKGETKSSKEIMALGTRSFNAIAGTTLGVDSRGGGTPNFRGARSEGTAYYIDGVRVQAGSINVPQNAIDQIQVITGGTPAQYGDFIGGAISITTKAPTKNFTRAFEYITASPFAGYLDYTHYNQFQTVISGPLKVINKGRGDQEKVLIGFLFSGAVTYARDGRPPAVDLYKVKDEKLAELKERPLVPGPGGTLFFAGEFLTKNDLERVRFRQNAQTFSADINGNFNYQPTNNINIRVGYFGNHSRNRNYSHFHSLMNYENNPLVLNYTGRFYVQFTQTFKKNTEDGANKEEKKSVISNAFYTARASYEISYGESMDANFGRDIFRYGHIGRFTTYQAPNFTRVVKGFGERPDSFLLENGTYIYLTNYFRQTGFRDTAVLFEQGPDNRIRGNYTKNVLDYFGARNITNVNTLRSLNGLINGDNPNGIYSNMWGNVGQLIAGSYGKSMAETYTAYVMSEFSIAPRSNPKAKHDIQFGMTFEQQFRRSYSIGGNGLWALMRLYQNRQFSGMDSTSSRLVFDANGVFQDTVFLNRKIVAADQTNFDRNLRRKLIAEGATDALGRPITEQTFLDINSYDPSTFSIDMFSADELLNNGNSVVSYFGYDHMGNIVRGKPNIDAFLTQRDANGNFARLLPAYQPNYFAAWAQDKFVFKDLVVRLGVRVERFDANQPVLKDPYSMVPVYTVGEVKSSNNTNFAALKEQIPSVIGDDYVVYVNREPELQSSSGMSITGFRRGTNWFDRNGNPISDPQAIARAGNTNRNIPLLVDPENPQRPTAASFRDYIPDVRVLPRVWFSFPISTTSQFFGTYDILTQRPGTNVAQIDDYFFLQNRLNNAIANPDLRMTQVTDYEIGFRQQIGTDAALGIIASYREYRGLVQLFPYIQAWPNTYNTLSNIDFATVKSLGLEYNVRELGNISLNANYQLQFADGTGSNATSSGALIQVGLPSLRTVFPLDFDTRHTFKAIFDFHYKEGKDYNGPRVNGKNIFENAGFNFIFTAFSGRPYTRNLLPTPDGVQSGVVVRSPIVGTINGANMPPQYNVDLNVDKNFMFKQKRIDGSVTVYRLRTFLWVQNLFNVANVLSVFRYTGSAYNDGFLTSPQAQEQIRTATQQQAYIDLYNTRMLNPDRFLMPRLTRLGVALYF
jgi:hypothetical protein